MRHPLTRMVRDRYPVECSAILPTKSQTRDEQRNLAASPETSPASPNRSKGGP